VETSERLLGLQMAKSFQKNLVVWKRKSEIELLEDGKEVSEELSSVET